jgi:Nucleotidyl transferase AbiEii toxin, Type IV TA system
MNIFEILNQKSRELELPFLVIGGHAVIAHGYERQTADLDLLVRGADRAAWKIFMTGLGYKLYHGQDTFAQFTPPDLETWPVDLMFVNEQTFSKMNAAGREIKMEGMAVRVASVENLLALKLHALAYTHTRRELKDLLDVVNLIEANSIDINGEMFKQLCERYGNERIRDKIIAASSR